MKVLFKKDYPHTFKTFKKGDIVTLHWTLADELIKKKVVVETSEVTNEEIGIKKALKEGK